MLFRSKEIFDTHMKTANQLHITKKDFHCSKEELLAVPEGTITEKGLRHNINVGILYLESWLRGNGAAAIYNLMEDAATAEICRTQVWQWIHHRAKLDDGREINQSLYEDLRDDEIEEIRQMVGSKAYQEGFYVQAICIFNKLVVQDKWEDFLTLSAYDHLLLHDKNYGGADTASVEEDEEIIQTLFTDMEKAG